MKLNKIGHIGIVVKDIEKAKEHYTKLMGIKKWYEIVYDGEIDLYYKEVKRNCNVKLYFGGDGHTVIELIETQGDENIYTNYLKNHGEGLHHIQYNVKNLDSAINDAKLEGLSVFQHAEFSSGGAKVRYAYVGKSEDDVIFELIETTILGGIKKGDLPFETQMAALTGSYKAL